MAKKESLGKVPKAEKVEAVNPAPDKDKDYEAEDAARDLIRAEEHKQNPDLMKRVHKHIDKKKKVIKSISDLKKAKKDLEKEIDDESKS